MIIPAWKLVAGTAALLTAVACTTPLNFPEPDLLPEATTGIGGAVGFCSRDSDGLTVRVRNQTNNDVFVETITRVTFSPGNIPVDRSTPPMPGGSFADTGPFPIPSSCFNPDCGFTITVDATDLVDESHGEAPDSHETNNTVQGRCIG